MKGNCGLTKRSRNGSGCGVDGEMATPVLRIGCAHFSRMTILALNRRKKKAANGVVYPFDCAIADA